MKKRKTSFLSKPSFSIWFLVWIYLIVLDDLVGANGVLNYALEGVMLILVIISQSVYRDENPRK